MSVCSECDKPIGAGAARRTGGYCSDHEYLDKAQAGRRLHVAVSTIDRLLRDGRLKGLKPLPGRVLIRRADIERMFIA